jgi:hypothetical protein
MAEMRAHTCLPPKVCDAPYLPPRVYLEIMGSIIIRTGWDFPTIPHCCDPMISTRTRVCSNLPTCMLRCHRRGWLVTNARTAPHDWWHRCDGGASVGWAAC